jgi:hypothetical protein|tara:strand:- start:1679 stop:2194 length:516 start_codon:yes stop_codon:yes gene_type:complete
VNQKQAEERIQELKGYYSHVAAYLAVNLFLIAINLMNWEGEVWFVYPLFGWGIGLFIHTMTVFVAGHDWEKRKLQELRGWSITQDELAKLSERTDNLVKILSSINWENIDPDLINTRDQIKSTINRIEELQKHGHLESDDSLSKEDVFKEIEKLEEFVTSTKFSFYDKAQT